MAKLIKEYVFGKKVALDRLDCLTKLDYLVLVICVRFDIYQVIYTKVGE